MSASKIKTLKQTRFLRGTRKLKLEGEKLHFDSVSPDQSVATTIPLHHLDSNPQRHRNTSISGVVFLSFLFGMGLLVLLFSIVVAWGTDEFWSWAIIYISLWIAGVAGTFGYLKRTYDYVVYPNLAGGLPVTLFPDKPSEAEFAEFSKYFESEIANSRNVVGASTNDINEAIRILVDAGLLDDRQVEEIMGNGSQNQGNTIN